jgi:hypothetical protein
MRKLYLLILSAIPCSLLAQSEKQKKPVDSITYYQNEMTRMYREIIDSFHNSEAYQSAYANYRDQLKKSKGYTSFIIFMDVFHADYKQFNAMLAQDGFPPLNETGFRIGFGGSRRINQFIVDLYLMAIGLNNKTSRGIETVKTNFSNLLHFDLGYDFLNKSWLGIYPYGGLSLRFSSVRYEKKAIANPDYTSIVNMLSDQNIVSLESTRIGYQLGVGFDVPLFQSKDKLRKTILFIKAGTNRPFGKDKYKHNDIPDYQPDIKQGDWMITVGFKFANKN